MKSIRERGGELGKRGAVGGAGGGGKVWRRCAGEVGRPGDGSPGGGAGKGRSPGRGGTAGLRERWRRRRDLNPRWTVKPKPH